MNTKYQSLSEALNPRYKVETLSPDICSKYRKEMKFSMCELVDNKYFTLLEAMSKKPLPIVFTIGNSKAYDKCVDTPVYKSPTKTVFRTYQEAYKHLQRGVYINNKQVKANVYGVLAKWYKDVDNIKQDVGTLKKKALIFKYLYHGSPSSKFNTLIPQIYY